MTIDSTVHDLRIAVRSLLRQRGFTTVVVLTLALGTGATTAIFGVVYGVLLRPLPYVESDRLVRLWQTARDAPGPDVGGSVAHVNFLDWKQQAKTLESVALYGAARFVVTGLGDAEAVPAGIVTPGFFRVFKATPIVGREFTADEDLPAGPEAIIVSYGFWKDRLAGRQDVLSTAIDVSGRPRPVVGVAPPGFEFPRGAKLWMTVKNDDARCGRDCVYLNGIGRLAPGASVESARQEMTAIAARLESEFPNANTNVTVALTTLQDHTVGSVRPALRILLAAVAMVLLIACANVANLVLVRGTARQSETAVRAALGATRARLVQYLLTESVVLALAGGALGLVFAWWSVGALKAMAPPDIPRLDEVTFDLPTFLFALTVAAASALLFGAGPALQSSRAPIASVLASRGEATHPRTRWTRSALLIAEVSLSVMLLLGAGLLLRSLARLQSVDPGFRPEGITTFMIALPAARYADDRVVAAHDEIDARLAALPGVESVGRISGLPLGTSENVLSWTRPDRPAPLPGQGPVSLYRVVDPDYFRTMSISILAGRAFDANDRFGGQPVVIISRRMADRFWQGEEALGKAVVISGGAPAIIVGIAADVRSAALDRDPQPEMYVPHAQARTRAVTYVVRARTAGAVLAAARGVIQQFDPRLPMISAATLQQLVGAAMGRPRFYLLLLGLFAVLALVLAAVGVYGVVAYAVSQRTREIGIRMALGARAIEVVRLVLWQGFRPAIAGVILGLAVAFAASRAMADLLYEIRPHDPATFAGVTLVLLAVVVLACVIPARRATKVPPATALRGE